VDNHTKPLNEKNSMELVPLFILSLLNSELSSTSWKLNIGNYKIGRSSDNIIILDDITVSRFHAEISISENSILINDKNSTNGTYLNNKIITSSYLNSGDKIQIGKYLFLLTKV